MKNPVDADKLIDELIEKKYSEHKFSLNDLMKLVEGQLDELYKIGSEEPYSGKYQKGPPDFEENVEQGKQIAYAAGMHGDPRNPLSPESNDEHQPSVGAGLANKPPFSGVEMFEGDENQAIVSKQEDRILKLPKLQISENWGKLNTIERSELKNIVDSATKGHTEVFDKLKVIQEQMTKLTGGSLGKIRNPSRILSQIILLETLNRLFKSFQPSPAGFINEAFLSVFYGGYQIAAGEANVSKNIGDVIDSAGIPISIKTKAEKKLNVDGSIENLYLSINSSGKVYFDIYEKISGGAGADKHVGVLNVYRFEVNKQNINQFLGKNYFSIDENGNLKPRGQFGRLREARATITPELINLAQKIFNYDVFNEKLLKKDIKNLSQDEVSSLIELLKTSLSNASTQEKKAEVVKAINFLGDVQISQKDIEKFSGFLEREFYIPEAKWRPFANKYYKETIQIKFSDEQINNALQSAVKDLDQSVVNIFNSLDGFSKSINNYLTSITPNRTQEGKKALQFAKSLEPQTKEVVQKTTTEEP